MLSWLSRHGTLVRVGLVVAVGAAAAVLAQSFVSATGDVGPGRVSLDARWDTSGTTTIDIPPLGSVLFSTHDAPLGVTARVESIDPVAVQRLSGTPGALERVQAEARSDLRNLAITLLWRSLLVATIVGVVVGIVLFRWQWLYPVVGGVAGAVVVGALLAGVWLGFAPDAFAKPQFEGALQEAPAVLAAVKKEWGNLEGVRDRLQILAGQVTELFALAASPAPSTGTDGEVRILHISDIHSNVIGLELVRNLATNFDVDAVIDTGDLTSFGLPVEATLGQLIAEMPVPYYLVPGNHDSMQNRAALDRYERLTVVDGAIVDIRGVRVLGVADPAVTANGEDSDAEANAKRDSQAPRVESLVRSLKPDVLAVSTLRQAAGSIGQVPLVVTGNTHRRSERIQGTTRVLTVGSTGATGIGSLTVDTALPYEAEVLHFRNRRLVTIDYVVLKGVSGSYTIDRSVISSSRAAPKPETRSPTSTSSGTDRPPPTT